MKAAANGSWDESDAPVQDPKFGQVTTSRALNVQDNGILPWPESLAPYPAPYGDCDREDFDGGSVELDGAQDTAKCSQAGSNGVPMLVMNVEAGRFIDGEKVTSAVKGRLKNLTMHTIAHGSHAFFFESREEYVDELFKFAKRVFVNSSKDMATTFNATVAIAERFITSSDGTSVFTQAVGDSRLPTLVFIHGLAMSALVWATILQDANLLRSFHLIAYDLRGHGRSGKPDTVEGYSSELYAQDFNAVVQAFNVTSPILVGWSLGAIIATDVTTYFGPDALAGIVYTAALPWLSVLPTVTTPWVQGLVPGFTTTTDSDLSLATRIEFVNQLFNHPERVPTEVSWSWLGGTVLQPPSKFDFLITRTQNTTNLFEAGANGVPLLVVNGETDRYIIGEKVVEVVDGHFTDLTVHTIANGSHTLFYENQEEYVRELAKFASRVFASRSN
ncbi:hypothetical protein NMY22_g13055 [Coprinellus aureogranulatus]|nr:hypothetical protein NMY22_g13055 [Coprinellus aureogranulatus]